MNLKFLLHAETSDIEVADCRLSDKASFLFFLPLVVHWVGSCDEWGDWELVDSRGSLDCHGDTDTQRAWNYKDRKCPHKREKSHRSKINMI